MQCTNPSFTLALTSALVLPTPRLPPIQMRQPDALQKPPNRIRLAFLIGSSHLTPASASAIASPSAPLNSRVPQVRVLGPGANLGLPLTRTHPLPTIHYPLHSPPLTFGA